MNRDAPLIIFLVSIGIILFLYLKKLESLGRDDSVRLENLITKALLNEIEEDEEGDWIDEVDEDDWTEPEYYE